MVLTAQNVALLPTTKPLNNYQRRNYDNIALQSKDSRYLSVTKYAVKLLKVWTEESLQKLVEYDRPGEHSPQ